MAGVSQIVVPLTQLTLAPDSATAESKAVLPLAAPHYSSSPQPVPSQSLEYTFYVVFGAGTAAGVVKIETAHDRDYTGTWATEATVTWAAATSVQAVHLTILAAAVRARISTTVTGGTVQVWYMAANRV